MKQLGFYLILILCIPQLNVHCQCTFPPSLTGAWYGADRGLMIFENSTFLSSYKTLDTDHLLPDALDFICYDKRENEFLLKSTHVRNFPTIGILNVKFYLCLEIHIVDDNIAYYYQMTDYDLFIKEEVYGHVYDNVTMDNVCSRNKEARNFIIMVKKDAIENGEVNKTCPEPILALFANVTIQRFGSTDTYNCQESVFDVCADRTKIAVSYGSDCNNTEAKTLSNTGMYQCIHSLSDGSTTFLAVWNNEIGVTNPFSCFAIQNVDDKIYATESPKYCSNISSALNEESGGVRIVLTNITKTCKDVPTSKYTTVEYTYTSVSTQSPDNASLWGLSIVPAILVLAICCAIWAYRKHVSRRRNQHRVFGSRILHVDMSSKPIFDPSNIPRKVREFRQEKQSDIFTPIFEYKWEETTLRRFTPVPKVVPLYSDVFDD